jgi:hypothetical protein
MKRILLLLVCALLCMGAVAQKKQVALVTFYSDKKIGGTGLGTAVESLVNDPSFDLKTLVNKSYNRFVGEFAKDFPFALIDNSQITSNESYKNYKSGLMADTSKTINKLFGLQYAIAGEMIFAYGDNQGLLKEEKRDPCNLAKIFPAADGILFVTMDYEFEPRLMGVAAGVRAYLNMFLYDKKCDKVFRIRESAPSKGKVPAIAGVPVMDPKKIQPLCEDATDQLFNDLKDRLAKVVKKSGNL